MGVKRYLPPFRQAWRLIVFGLAVVLCTTLILAIYPLPDKCDYTNGGGNQPQLDVGGALPKHDALVFRDRDQRGSPEEEEGAGDDPTWGPHKLAIVVPFRDRFDELLEFVPHMHNFLNAQRVRHRIVVVNQQDIYRFNRAALINIGFLENRADCDYLAMHDVDLLPLNTLLNYSYPASGPFHIAAPNLHPQYHYETFVGGILLLTKDQFEVTNGLSNKYWGWGREDDEFYVRMKDAKLKIHRPEGIHTGYDTFKHLHDKQRRPRDNRRYGNQKADTRKRDRISGIDTIDYRVLTRQPLLIAGAPVTILNVHLSCDLTKTPWCVFPDQLQQMIHDLEKEDMPREEIQKIQDQIFKQQAQFDKDLKKPDDHQNGHHGHHKHHKR